MSNPYMEEAEAIRASSDGLAQGQTDEKLVENKAAFPWWNGDRVNYLTGMLVQYGENLYRVVQSHISQSDWTPDKTPALFTKISTEEFPEWVQPTGAQDAYMSGDKVTHNSKHWISTADNNVWEPGVYGWDEVI